MIECTELNIMKELMMIIILIITVIDHHTVNIMNI